MNEKISTARDLYFNTGKTQREIAAIVGVTERTIYNWVRTHNWQQIREASYHMPALIAENLCRQVVELQSQVEAREQGNRYPTPQEAEVQRKLITCLEKMKRFPTLGMYRQMFASFFEHIDSKDVTFKFRLKLAAEDFFEAKLKNGFAAWEPERYATQPQPYTEPENIGAIPDEEQPEEATISVSLADINNPLSAKQNINKELQEIEKNLPENASMKDPDYLKQLIINQRIKQKKLAPDQPEKTGNAEASLTQAPTHNPVISSTPSPNPKTTPAPISAPPPNTSPSAPNPKPTPKPSRLIKRY